MSRARLVALAKLVAFLLALDGFFVAIQLLDAFKDIGSGFGEELMQGLAGRPLLGVLVGLLVTSVIQSSSTTTAIAVGLTAAGVFGEDPVEALRTAVPIIMGANVGTTVTNTIVSFGHIDRPEEFRRAFAAATVHDIFNLLSVAVLLPLQIATNFLGRLAWLIAEALSGRGGLRFASPLRAFVHPQTEAVGRLFDVSPVPDFVVILTLVLLLLWALGLLEARRRVGKGASPHALGLALVVALVVLLLRHYPHFVFDEPVGLFLFGLFLLLAALYCIVRVMRSVVLDRVARVFQQHVFKTTARALLLGLVLTTLVQSSSVTTSLVVPLAGAGILSVRQVFPYSLGANLGTTVTAFLAAMALSEPVALAVALAHFLFNAFGILVFLPLRRLPISLAEALATGALRSRLVPVGYVVGVYILLPLLLILLLGEVG